MIAVWSLEVAHNVFDIIALVSFAVFAARRYNASIGGASRSPITDAV